jgi:hypothetical protein
MSDGEFFRSLLEVFKTKEVLTWTDQSGLSTTTFVLDGQTYSITIREDFSNSVSFYEVSFAIIEGCGEKSHAVTNFNKNQFKILGIVSNGIKEKIPNARVVYFVAKSGTSKNQIEYESRTRLYSRIAHKVAMELSMFEEIIPLEDETVFIIAKTQQLLNLVKGQV